MTRRTTEPGSKTDTPTPGLESVSADRLAELIDLGTESIDQPPPPDPPPMRRGPSLAGALFGVLVTGLIIAIGWWSWRMVGMGAERYTSKNGAASSQLPVTPKQPLSAWAQASVDTLYSDGEAFALEAAFNARADEILTTYSDGSTRRIPIQNGVFGEPVRLTSMAAYPLAVMFDDDANPALIVSSGLRTERWIDGRVQNEALDPPVMEVYSLTPDRMLAAPLPFDGSTLIVRDGVSLRLPGTRFAGLDSPGDVVLLIDRGAPDRIGILRPTDGAPRYVAAPKDTERAAISPDGKQLAVVLSDGELVCMDAGTGGVIWRRDAVPGIQRLLAHYTPDGSLIVAEHRLLLLGGESGEVIADLTPEADLPLEAFDLVFSEDGRHLCVLGNDLHLLSIQP